LSTGTFYLVFHLRWSFVWSPSMMEAVMTSPHFLEPSLTGRTWSSTRTDRVNVDILADGAWVLDWLERRGLDSEAQVEHYLRPRLANLDDPQTMAGMASAVDRIVEALNKRESLAVYGDYDVDGVCSTALIVEFLRRIGAKVSFYIPDRRAEGYGLHLEAVRKLSTEADVLITTDCGITAHQELELAQQLGMDVIVVDHHQVLDTLPPAVACLDPHRSDCKFPCKHLCATGVAFMLVGALRRHMREQGMFQAGSEPDLRELLDLVAIATVADMVPLVDANRVLVSAGLQQLSKTRRVGLRALMDVSGIDPSRVNASDLGFRLGPRINARGRLSHAGAAVDLMLTTDPTKAKALAKSLDEANTQRRHIEKSTLEEALAQIEQEGLGDSAGLCVYNPSWHPGVLGLVATRLAQRYQRPAIAIGEGGKGSGRSYAELNLYECMSKAEQFLQRFGGHAQAAGLTIEPKNVPLFRSCFNDALKALAGDPPYSMPLEPDLEVDTAVLDLALVKQQERLEPFGQKNPKPLFVSRNVTIVSKTVVGGTHLKLRLGQQGLDAIAFGLGDLAKTLPPKVDMVYRLDNNYFRGRENLQLLVEDMRPSANSA
jgi:single-stranded-DNA-specific exonuclease